ncbi:MAG: M28 family peptidase [bacterium]
MKRSALIIIMTGLAVLIWGDYLNIVKPEKDTEIYHTVGDIALSRTEAPAGNSLKSVLMDNDDFYLIEHIPAVHSIPSDAVVYSDFENDFMIIRDTGGIDFNYRQSEITRLFMDEPAVKGTAPAGTMGAKTDYQLLDSIASFVSEDSLYSTVAVLSGEYPYPSGYYNVSRFVDQPGCDTATNYLAAKFTHYGYDSVYTFPFTGTFSSWLGGGTFNTQNVVAFKEGYGTSDECIVIGAHFDAISYPADDHTTIAPGADDNASGTAGVLEIARTLYSIDTERDIYFVCFSGEEEGLYGSYYFVYDYIVPESISVYSMINLDMIGYTSSGYGVNLHGKTLSSPLINLHKDISDNITGLTSYIAGSSSGSDHYYFEQAGIRSVFAIENEFSPVYHSYQDSIAYMNPAFMTDVVKASTGTAYSVAFMPVSPFTVNASDNGDSSVAVTWTLSSSNDISGYRVYYNDSYIDAPDTNQYTLESLTPGTLYNIHVTALDTQGFEGFAEAYDTVTPSDIPHSVSIREFSADSQSISIVYSSSLSGDIDHYNIYRKEGASAFELLDSVSDTFYTDNTPAEQYVYNYYVTAVDTDSYESNPSDTARARIVSLNEYMIVIDETKNNSTLLTDSHVDAFYDSVFEGYTHYLWDADSASGVNISHFGNYAILVYIDDDLTESKLYMPHIEDYIENGGKAILMGWDIGSVILDNPSVFPASSGSSSIASDFFNIDTYNRNQGFDMDYLNYSFNAENDSFYFSPDKLPRGSGGNLSYSGVFGLIDSNVSDMASYHSVSDDSAFAGKPVIYRNNDNNMIVANIPLFPLIESDGKSLMDNLLSQLGCYSGLTGRDTGVSRSVELLSRVSSGIIEMNIEGFGGSSIDIALYSADGRLASRILSSVPGKNSISVSRRVNVPSGIYFIKINSGDYSSTEKIYMIQ